MNWIGILKSPSNITEAVSHVNQAIKLIEGYGSSVEISRSLFDALNKIQTEWAFSSWAPTDIINEDGRLRELYTFQKMILFGLTQQFRKEFLNNDNVRSLVFFEPRIMNHDTLRLNKYRPNDIEPSLIKKASKEHNDVVTAYNSFLDSKNDEIAEKPIKRIAELLYIVRSNINHGEKTPYGPDLNKSERDEAVCKLVIPTQIMLINFLLDRPDQKLATYGTLAPEQSNNGVLSSLEGDWSKGKVKGFLTENNGLPYLEWNARGELLDINIFISKRLPLCWDKIDRFEGKTYLRRLVTAETDDGFVVAHCYLKASAL